MLHEKAKAIDAVQRLLTIPAERAALPPRCARSSTRRPTRRIERERDLSAFLHVARDAALDAARAVDARRKSGEPAGKLAGVPIAIKDALCTKDAPTTCASKILVRGKAGEAASSPEGGWRPPYRGASTKSNPSTRSSPAAWSHMELPVG